MYSLYILKSDIEEDDNCYIGITTNPKKRLQRHIIYSKTNDFHSSRWIRKIISQNGHIKMTILLDNLTEEEAYKEEIRHIKLYRGLGYKLTNITDGGTGFSSGENNPSYKHGLRFTKEYDIYANIKRWRFNKNDPNYIGDKISMYYKWINDAALFIDYIKTLNNYGKENYILTRIDTNKNFEPNNLEWISKHIRSAKQRKQSNNNSGYIGVVYNPRLNKWIAQIGVDKKRKHIGCYNTKEEALTGRNNYIFDNNLIGYKIQKF